MEIQSQTCTASRMATYCSRISSMLVALMYDRCSEPSEGERRCSRRAASSAPAMPPNGRVHVHGPFVSMVDSTNSMSWLYSERRCRQPR